MKLSTLIKLLIWLCSFILLVDLASYMITMPNTMLNIGGVFVFALTIYFSIITKCLTNLRNKKNEKEN